MSKKPKQYEDEPEMVQMLGIGAYGFMPKSGKPAVRIVGFVRPKTPKVKTPKQSPQKRKTK